VNPEIRGGAVFPDAGLRLTGTSSIVTGGNTRLHGPGVFRNEGRLTEGAVWFDGDIENAGEWTYATSIHPRYGGLFRSFPGATYTVTNLTGSLSEGPKPGVFDNAGLIRQLGKGNARLPFAVTNRGIIEITDTLTVAGGITQPVEGLI